MTACPPPEALARLLDGPLPAADADAVRAHLAACPACRAYLDELTDAPELRGRPADTPLPSPDTPQLRRVVAALIDGGPALPDPVFDPPARPGDLGAVGPYRIQGEIDRGGMGVVYRGYDDDLRRPVAIKLVPQTPGADTARLVREARAAARFTHDNAVRVYAVGTTPAGVPYLVMEYLDGVPLGSLVRPGRPLDPARAVGHVAEAADALAAAHAAGLVHRDVKPGNILVETATGRAKILDFGLARLADTGSVASEDGALAGTLTYMSPEQARGEEADPRADVYGLGATLYELLTGEVPFRGTPAVVLRQVLSDEPRPPRQLCERVPRDLETVCLKAMAKEPRRRYPSAAAFADDLRRWQRGEPVLARPVGPVGRGWRWCRRNPRVAALTAAVLGLLTALAAGGTTAAVVIDADRREIAGTRDELAAALKSADDNAAASAAHFNLALDSYGTVVREIQGQFRSKPGLLPVRQKVLEATAAGLERVARGAADTPAAAEPMAVAHDQLAELFTMLGKPTPAREQVDRAVRTAEAVLAARPGNATARRVLAASHDRLGRFAEDANDAATARRHYTAALDIRKELLAADPTGRTALRDLSVSHNKLGTLAMRRGGDAEAARAAFAEALRLREAAGGADENPEVYGADVNRCHTLLGEACMKLGDFPAARRHLTRAIEVAEGMAAAGVRRGVSDAAESFEELSRVATYEGKYDEAADHARAAVTRRKAWADADPENVPTRGGVYVSQYRLGDALTAARRHDEARAVYREAIDRCEALARQVPDTPLFQNDLLLGYSKIAGMEHQAERYADAVTWTERAVEHLKGLEKAGFKAFGNGMTPAQARAVFEADLPAYRFAANRGLDDLPAIQVQPPALRSRLLGDRALALARRGQHGPAAETIALYIQNPPGDPSWPYTAACVYALCAADPPPADRRQYAELAVRYLKQFVGSNPRLVYMVLPQQDLAAIHGEPGYRDVVATLYRPKSTAK